MATDADKYLSRYYVIHHIDLVPHHVTIKGDDDRIIEMTFSFSRPLQKGESFDD